MVFTKNSASLTTLLFVALMLFSLKSHASWIIIGETKQSIHYIDQSRIKKTSSGIDVWWLMNFKPHIANQIGFASVLGNSIIDCKKQILMDVEKTNFTETFADGLGTQDAVNGTWTSYKPKPNSLQESLFKSICNK